jgi:hypothetical protein
MLGQGGEAVTAAANATPMDTIAQAAGGLGEAAGKVATAGKAAATGAGKAAAAAGQEPGLLSKAAGAAWDFLKSDAGGQVATSIIKGYAEGAQEEERMKEEERVRRYYDNQWRDPAKLAQLKGAVAGDVSVPGGYLSRAQNSARTLAAGTSNYPSGGVPSPAELAGYARSPGT